MYSSAEVSNTEEAAQRGLVKVCDPTGVPQNCLGGAPQPPRGSMDEMQELIRFLIVIYGMVVQALLRL